MRKAVGLVALLLLAGSGLALPGSHAPAPSTPLQRFEAQFAKDFHGADLSAPLGTRTLINPDGTRAAQRITGQEFLEDARSFLAHFPHGTLRAEGPVLPIGVGAGAPALDLPLHWPYCDVASLGIWWFGVRDSGWSPVTEAEPAPVQVPLGQGGCQGYPPILTWQSVAFDASDPPPRVTTSGLCADAQVFYQVGSTDVGPLDGACGFTSGSLHGNAQFDLEEYCFFGICDDLAYALGAGDTIAVGPGEVIPA